MLNGAGPVAGEYLKSHFISLILSWIKFETGSWIIHNFPHNALFPEMKNYMNIVMIMLLIIEWAQFDAERRRASCRRANVDFFLINFEFD